MMQADIWQYGQTKDVTHYRRVSNINSMLPPTDTFPYWTFFRDNDRVFVHLSAADELQLKEVEIDGNKEEVKSKEDR